jgi:hypothetical protein
MQAEMARVLKRLASLSVSMMRADATWEAYHREMTKVIQSGLTDEQLIAPLNRQLARVENNDFLRAAGHHTTWLAQLYVVVEGWRKWSFFDPTVDALLTSEHVTERKKYRHAIFHADEFDARAVMQFDATGERTKWVTELGNALRQALRDWQANLPDRITEYLRRSPL